MPSFVVDVDGVRVRNHRKREPPPVKAPSRPTMKDFRDLEDAIHEQPLFRQKFYRLCGNPSPGEALKMKVDGQTKMRVLALRYCWSQLMWRPSNDKKRVIIKLSCNPYMT